MQPLALGLPAAALSLHLRHAGPQLRQLGGLLAHLHARAFKLGCPQNEMDEQLGTVPVLCVNVVF